MSDLSRFSDYATSGAFHVSLTRHQISALSLIAAGDYQLDLSAPAVAALERRGLVAFLSAQPSDVARMAECRPTAAGLLASDLCRLAGLTNASPAPWVAEIEALRTELAALRDQRWDALDACRAQLTIARQDVFSMNARLEKAELAREELQCEKDGVGFLKPIITLRDQQPMRYTSDIMAQAERPVP